MMLARSEVMRQVESSMFFCIQNIFPICFPAPIDYRSFCFVLFCADFVELDFSSIFRTDLAPVFMQTCDPQVRDREVA